MPQPNPQAKHGLVSILLKFGISLILMLLFGYVLTKSGFFEGWRRTPNTIYWRYGLGFIACMIVQHIFRVLRWRTVLAPFDIHDWWQTIYASSLGFASVLFLPLRSGEFIRPYLIRTDKFVMTKALGGIFLERVVDLSLLSTAMMVTLLLRSRTTLVPTWLTGLSMLCFAGVIVLLVGIYVFVCSHWGQRLAQQFPRELKQPHGLYKSGNLDKKMTIRSRIKTIGSTIISSFLNLRLGILPVFKPIIMFKLVWLSAAYWLANALSLVCLGKLLGLTTVGLIASICNVATVGIGVMVPAGPAMAGSWEFFSELSLKLYGNESYTQFILLSHGLNIIWYAVVCTVVWFMAIVLRTKQQPAPILA